MVDDVRRIGGSVDVVCFVIENSGVIGSPVCFSFGFVCNI